MIELVCADCAKLSKCKQAPPTMEGILQHTCTSWSPVHSCIIAARQDIYSKFGPSAREGFRRKERLMQPADIILAAKNGDVDTLEGLRGQEINPVNLMLAAANVVNGATVAESYRSLNGDDEARRNMMIDHLVEFAKSVSTSAPEEAEEKPAPKKRRSRRSSKKADETQTEIKMPDEDKEKAKAEFVKAQDAVASVPTVDLSEVLGAIKELGSRLDTIEGQLSELNQTRIIEVIDERVGQVKRNLSRVRNAFQDFEVELIGSGTIGSTPFLNATHDWEE